MEDTAVLKRSVITSEKRVRTHVNYAKKVQEVQSSPTETMDYAEVDENFRNYLTWHGLARKEKSLVLSSKLHYYYENEELKDVATLINLKKLNLIEHLDVFLKTIYSGLAPKANFVGCFSDSKSNHVSLTSRVYKKFINFIDSRVDFEIDRKDFSKLLESHGFKVVDMTEINGLTYFRSQNISRSA